MVRVDKLEKPDNNYEREQNKKLYMNKKMV
jgi:hypothetical protein